MSTLQDRLVVEIRPDPGLYPGSGEGWRELVVRVRVGGRDFEVGQPFRAAFFESVFRLLLDRAACEIERLVHEGPGAVAPEPDAPAPAAEVERLRAALRDCIECCGCTAAKRALRGQADDDG